MVHYQLSIVGSQTILWDQCDQKVQFFILKFSIIILNCSINMSKTEAKYDNDYNDLYKAAENGDINAQNNLAVMYYQGGGIERDLEKAFYWFQQAAEHGCNVTQNNLAIMYYEGEGIERNLEKAFYWYQKAAENG